MANEQETMTPIYTYMPPYTTPPTNKSKETKSLKILIYT